MPLRRRPQSTAFGLALLAISALGGRATAQTVPDPYKPYNLQYEQYIYPSYPNGIGVTPNQAVIEGRGVASANQFQRFLEEQDESDRAAPGSSVSPLRRGAGVPYYRAYREYDRTYGRVYTPNATADQRYLATRRSRDEAYSDYLAEKDPKRKADLLKEYEQYNRRALRQLTEGRLAGARRSTGIERGGRTELPPRPGTAPPSPANRGSGGAAGGSSSASDVLRRSDAMEPERSSGSAPPPNPNRPPRTAVPSNAR